MKIRKPFSTMVVGLVATSMALGFSLDDETSGSKSPADLVWEKVIDLPEGKESAGLALRERGLEFWNKFPDDSRRYEWLLMLKERSSMPPRYALDTQAADEAMKTWDVKTFYTLPNDPSKKARWDSIYSEIRKEAFSDPSFDRKQRRSLLWGELYWKIPDARYSALYNGKHTNVAALHQEALEFAKTYPEYSYYNKSIVKMFFSCGQTFGISEPEKMMAFLESYENVPGESLAEFIAGRKRLLELSETPLDLRFAAMDSREIDLKDYRGKVVFIDLWNSG